MCPAVTGWLSLEITKFFLEADPSRRSLLSNATVLINEGVKINGLRVWGSPTTMLYGGAFGLSKAADRHRLYATIPDDTDLLITHGPSYGIWDCAPGSDYHAGCPELLEAVQRVKPKLHIISTGATASSSRTGRFS
jgi:hypothetical protein